MQLPIQGICKFQFAHRTRTETPNGTIVWLLKLVHNGKPHQVAVSLDFIKSCQLAFLHQVLDCLRIFFLMICKAKTIHRLTWVRLQVLNFSLWNYKWGFGENRKIKYHAMVVHHAVTVAADSHFSPLLPSLAGRRLRWEGWQCLRTLRPTRGLRTSSCGWSWRSGCTWSRRGCSRCCSLGCSWCAPPSSFPHAPAALLLHLMYIHIQPAHFKLMHHPSLTLSLRLRAPEGPPEVVVTLVP